ncbi:AAA family ATPase [Nordella sp. HKS 07]|uniref:ATP-binding protein n=1 Tax=Nordella sp. HKS 07 TaxID=2712222 RepID=UPI0013E1F7C8|nr:ATP-binding protein [Nordella sp. HKS 07]QIG49840.1 AAA family ATPase [Nordella sp. HKS 07]
MARGKTMSRQQAKTADTRSWRERNDEIMHLGLAWISARLSGTGGEETARMAAAYQDARHRLREEENPPSIDRLSALFDLTPFDEDLLLLCHHAQLEGEPRPMTVQAAQALLGIGGFELATRAWDRLAPSAPLRRFRLIDGPDHTITAATPLLIDERVGRYLMGDDTLDRRISPLLIPVEGGPLLKRHRPLIGALAERLHQASRPLAMITGPKESGRRAAAMALARGFGLTLVEVKPRLLDAAPELMPILAREAILGRLALLIDIAQPDGQRLIEERFDGFTALTIAIADGRREFSFAVPMLRLDPLSDQDRLELWHEASGPHSPEARATMELIAQHFRFGPRLIGTVAREGGDLWRACREKASRELDELADRIIPNFGWDDIVLPPEVIHDLKAAVAQIRHSARVYGDHGMARKYPRGRGVSVLLSGPSGTGKTMAAEVVARDLDLDLFRVDLSRIVSKYIGETEKNLRAVFDAAETSGAVLFFDEADALFGKRSEVKDSHDRYANIEVSYLLQRMESYSGLAILATNMKNYFDPSFMRRIRYVIDIPFPDAEARRKIWRKAFPPELPCAALDFDMLARLDIAGGNISVIAINAAFLAAADGTPLGMQHIARAARAEYHKLDREFRSNLFGAASP